MSKPIVRLAGLLLGLAFICAATGEAFAAAPKSKFEQAKIKAGIIYKKYYKAAFDSSVLGPEFKEVHEEANRLREQFDKAAQEAVDLDPSVRRAEEALKRAENKPEDKQNPDEIASRTEAVHIARQNARDDIESEAHSHVFDAIEEDAEAPKKAAAPCGEVDQKRIAELNNRIGIYERRLAETQQELKNIKAALTTASKDELTQLQTRELIEKQAVFERRVQRLKHDLEGYRKELDAALNPKPCPPPGKTEEKKAEKTPEKKVRTQSKDKAAGETGVMTPGVSISIGGGSGTRREEQRGDRKEREQTQQPRGGFGGSGGGITFGR
jgi:chromosome segregation ATPase